MACINPDGSMTVVAQKVLRGFATGGTAEDAARLVSLPLYRVRASLRELTSAGLVQEAEGVYTLTEQGRGVLTL